MKALKSIFILFILSSFSLGLKAASLPVSIDGDHMIRLPGNSRYIKDNFQTLPDNVIVCIPDVESASSTLLLLNGHNIKLYPGVTFKISKGTFVPLTGRFEFSPEDTATAPINIVAHNCNAGYRDGHFLIEVTPDNGTFFALKDNGTVWVKDIQRNVYELKSGQQVHVPMFGPANFKTRLEAFWGKKPSSFNHLGEVGQETAYGIVGTDSDFYSKKTKKKDDTSAESEQISDNSEEITDEDYLDPEEEAWLNSDNGQEESDVEIEAGEKTENLTAITED